MRIGELAERTGVSTRLLRYYEAQDLLHPDREPNGYRCYRPMHVERVLQIRSLLDAGLPTELIHCALPCLDGNTIDVSEDPDGMLARRLRAEVDSITERIEVLTTHRDRILQYLVSAERGRPAEFA